MRQLGQLGALLAAFFYISLLTTIATAQDQTLQIGTPIERQLAARQAHNYTVTLEENTFIQVVVEQHGVDVVVRVAGPNDKNLGEYDTPNGTEGPENVSFVAVTAGTYRFTVTPLGQEEDVEEGNYQIKIVELRQATEQELKASKNLEVVKAKGIALLDEVEGVIAQIRSPQTRIRAQMQASQLLWNSDEKRATKFMADAVNGIKEFLATAGPNSEDYYKNYSTIMALRYELAHALAVHDPEAALNLIYATKLPFDPFGNQRERAVQETALELMIANEIQAKDPKRTLEIARKSLKNGYSPNLANTVATLRSKNPELATELGNEIVSRLMREKLLKSQDAAMLSANLLRACLPTDKVNHSFSRRAPVHDKPLFSEAVCRDLLQKSYQEAVNFTPSPPNMYTPERDAAWNLLNGLQQLGSELDTFIAGGSVSVEKKLAELTGSLNPGNVVVRAVQTKIGTGETEDALESIEKAPEEMRDQLYAQLASQAAANGEAARAKQIINDHIANPYQRRQALSNLKQQEMYQFMSRGKVEEALRAIATLRTPRERANILTQFARQIGPGQKRAAALNLLEQARSLLAPDLQAQDQEQMNALFELTRAFARYDSKRAFEIIEPLVDQLNDLCAAARTLEGFGPEYFDGEELDMDNGNSVASIAAQMGGALGTLALTNFERAKSTSDRLRLPEVRLRAYLEIAQQTIQSK